MRKKIAQNIVVHAGVRLALSFVMCNSSFFMQFNLKKDEHCAFHSSSLLHLR